MNPPNMEYETVFFPNSDRLVIGLAPADANVTPPINNIIPTINNIFIFQQVYISAKILYLLLYY